MTNKLEGSQLFQNKYFPEFQVQVYWIPGYFKTQTLPEAQRTHGLTP